jgi:hypothetical protein
MRIQRGIDQGRLLLSPALRVGVEIRSNSTAPALDCQAQVHRHHHVTKAPELHIAALNICWLCAGPYSEVEKVGCRGFNAGSDSRHGSATPGVAHAVSCRESMMASQTGEVTQLHLQRQGLLAVSANFELYGDMFQRMMTVEARYAPRQEVYGIDESFLDFDGVSGDLLPIGRDMLAAIWREVGLPSSLS